MSILRPVVRAYRFLPAVLCVSVVGGLVLSLPLIAGESGETVTRAATVACCTYLRAGVWRFGTLEREELRSTEPEGILRHVYRARECPAELETAAANPPREVWACVVEGKDPSAVERRVAIGFEPNHGRLLLAFAPVAESAIPQVTICAVEPGKQEFAGPPHRADGTVDLSAWSRPPDTTLIQIALPAGTAVQRVDLLPALLDWSTERILDKDTLVAIVPRDREALPLLFSVDSGKRSYQPLKLEVADLSKEAAPVHHLFERKDSSDPAGNPPSDADSKEPR